MVNRRKRIQTIGIFGGTFDPPHIGHLAIARNALKQFSLSRLYFVPVYVPPHKSVHSSTAARHRLAMTRILAKGQKKYFVSPIELSRKGVSYTIDTVRYFRKRFPAAKLLLIIGADNYAQFMLWKSPDEILKYASLAVYNRKGFTRVFKTKQKRAARISGRLYPISSTDVRMRLEQGVSVSDALTKPVNTYIKQHALYQPVHKINQERKHEICCACK